MNNNKKCNYMKEISVYFLVFNRKITKFAQRKFNIEQQLSGRRE